MSRIILANAALMPLSRISWQRAASLVVTGAALPLECGDPVKTIQGVSSTVVLYEVIYLPSVMHIPDMAHRSGYATKRSIHERDSWVCGYCGGHGTTIDHVLPKSRGGLNTYQNLVTACEDCNGKKGDRTPEEASMPLLFVPHDFDPYQNDSARITELFSLSQPGI